LKAHLGNLIHNEFYEEAQAVVNEVQRLEAIQAGKDLSEAGPPPVEVFTDVVHLKPNFFAVYS